MSSAYLPYAGTSGWSGSQTSYDRAMSNDQSGLTSKNQMRFMSDLLFTGSDGLTAREWGQLHNLEHQTYSSIPSILHEGGFVERLIEKRGKHQIYVLPEYVNGRETAPHRSKKQQTCSNCGHTEKEM